jgi:hypothetical protein
MPACSHIAAAPRVGTARPLLLSEYVTMNVKPGIPVIYTRLTAQYGLVILVA